MEKFQGKYRIPSARLQTWDYGWNSAYFITICTKNKISYFGKVVNQKMQLSHIGILADVFWYEIKNHAQNIELGNFIVMPNHLHGILILNSRDKARLVSTNANTNANTNETIGQQRFQNQGKNTISSIVGSYKAAVTKHARRLGYDFAWQSRFYDHIIRSDRAFERIAEYIINNPRNWQSDRFYAHKK